MTSACITQGEERHMSEKKRRVSYVSVSKTVRGGSKLRYGMTFEEGWEEKDMKRKK
jgi:hypothetical protein